MRELENDESVLAKQPAKFWLVWSSDPQRMMPTKARASLEAAEREAVRLTNLRSATFYVLEAVARFEQATPPVRRIALC